MDPVVGVIVAALITAASSPIWVKQINAWIESRNPSTGWQAATSALTTQVDELRAEVKDLRLEVRALEDANALKDRQIAEDAKVISEQSRALIARDARIGQLVHAWPDPPAPPPDPAYARDLGRD